VGSIIYMIRIVLVVLALRYVWRALKRAIQGERNPESRVRTQEAQSIFPDIKDAEDIEYEDIE